MTKQKIKALEREHDSDNIEPYLTEYRALRDEQKTRLTMNGSMINFILLIIGAEIAAYVQLSSGNNPDFFIPILLGTPLLTTPLTLFYYDNQLMFYRIGRYFAKELYPNIASVTGTNPFGWERFHRETSGQLSLVAFGRNLFFLLITFGPIIIFAFVRLGWPVIKWCFGASPAQIYSMLSTRLHGWELSLLGLDLLFLVAVVITWMHAGLYFLGPAPGRPIFHFFSQLWARLKRDKQRT